MLKPEELSLGDILNDRLGGNLEQIMDTIAVRSTEIISEVQYGENQGILQQLIGRVSTMSYTHRNKVQMAYQKLQDFKQANDIHNLGISLVKELALATYIFTYNDDKKHLKIEGVLEELELGSDNTNLSTLIVNLASKKENKLPSYYIKETHENPLTPNYRNAA